MTLLGLALAASSDGVLTEAHEAQHAAATAESRADEDCAVHTDTCNDVVKMHVATKMETATKLQQCDKSRAQKTTMLSAYITHNSHDQKQLRDLEGRAAVLAAKATAQEAEDEGMVMHDDDFGEDESDKDTVKEVSKGGLPGIKDALQKAEAVLTYNEIQSDRLFKKADKMASNPKLLTTTAGMKTVKSAAKSAAKAASARFIAEVEVTKLKAAMQAAEKVEGNGSEKVKEELGASQKPEVPGASTIAKIQKPGEATIAEEKARMLKKMAQVQKSGGQAVAELGPDSPQ